jgi:hypothetical protein
VQAPEAVPIGHVELRATDNSVTLRCLLGADAPRPSGGYGGWSSVDRGTRPPIITYTGPEALTVTVPLLLEDAVVAAPATRVKVARLERLAGLPGSGALRGDGEPPTVRLAANLPGVAHEEREWVVAGLEWGEAHFGPYGGLRRQEATVTLMEYREAAEVERVRRSDPFQRRTMRKGETLRHFARRTLGDPRRWRDIAALNADNPHCPKAPDAKLGRDRLFKVPPREPVRRRKPKPKGGR